MKLDWTWQCGCVLCILCVYGRGCQCVVTHVQVWTRVSVCGDTCAGMDEGVSVW